MGFCNKRKYVMEGKKSTNTESEERMDDLPIESEQNKVGILDIMVKIIVEHIKKMNGKG